MIHHPKVLAVLLFLSFGVSLKSQERYKEEMADSVWIETYRYALKEGRPLEMDVFSPAFDNAKKRPLIFYLYDGYFSNGQRSEPEIKAFCKKLAKFGYVVSSISYRLPMPKALCDLSASEKLTALKKATEDLQDASAFLIRLKDKVGIDPYRIILSGSGTGAEVALNTAYQPPYCYGLDDGPVSYAGVISMAGAIPDTTRIYSESAIPSLLFHGTCDEWDPYSSAPYHNCKKKQAGYLLGHGAYKIAEKLRKTGTPFWLVTYCNAGHQIAKLPMTSNFDMIIDFCYNLVLKNRLEQKNTVIKSTEAICADSSIDFCKE